MAQQTAQQATTRVQTVETVVTNIDQYKAQNQAEILFRPGQSRSQQKRQGRDSTPWPPASRASTATSLKCRASLPAGPGRHYHLAEDGRVGGPLPRAEHEIPVYRIYLVGMGNAPTADETTKTKRMQRRPRRNQPPEERPGAALRQQRSPGHHHRSSAATEISLGPEFGTQVWDDGRLAQLSLPQKKPLAQARGFLSVRALLTLPLCSRQ